MAASLYLQFSVTIPADGKIDTILYH